MTFVTDAVGASDAPLSTARVDQYSRHSLPYGVGVALGYRGVVAIDLDSDDSAVIAAVRKVLEPSPVAKVGARGRTDFYIATSGSDRSQRIAGVDGMMVEVLSRGTQTVVPPTVHPTTGQPYRWLGTTGLCAVSVGALPDLPANVAALLAEELRPWMKREAPRLKATTLPRRSSVELTEAERVRHHRYASSILQRELERLAGMAPASGRNDALFHLVCRVGRWCHAGILQPPQVVAALVDACITNGLVRDDGMSSVLATIASGLDKSKNDPLPDLGAGRSRGA